MKKYPFSLFETFTIMSLMMMTFIVIVQSCTIVGIERSLDEIREEIRIQREINSRILGIVHSVSETGAITITKGAYL